MTKTHCDCCGREILNLQVNPKAESYGHCGASPGFHLLLPQDMTCAQVRFQWFDLCQGCAIDVGLAVRTTIFERKPHA